MEMGCRRAGFPGFCVSCWLFYELQIGNVNNESVSGPDQWRVKRSIEASVGLLLTLSFFLSLFFFWNDKLARCLIHVLNLSSVFRGSGGWECKKERINIYLAWQHTATEGNLSWEQLNEAVPQQSPLPLHLLHLHSLSVPLLPDLLHRGFPPHLDAPLNAAF